mgnify:CR=1 FL=1
MAGVEKLKEAGILWEFSLFNLIELVRLRSRWYLNVHFFRYFELSKKIGLYWYRFIVWK